MNTTTPIRPNPKARRWITPIAVLGTLAVAAGAYWVWHTFKDYRFHPAAGWGKNNSLETKGGIPGAYLEVHWPGNATGIQPPVTFRIPREYVDQRSTWTDEQGIKTIAVRFELPGLTPWQKSSVQKRVKIGGEARREAPSVESQRRFTMHIKRDSHMGYAVRMAMRREAQPKEIKSGGSTNHYMRDIDFAGLERYSAIRCYTPEHLKNPPMKKFLDEKEPDDPSPSNCRLDRSWAILVSPPEVKNDEKGVGIDCSSTGCRAKFSVAGRGISMYVRHAEISRWKELVEPARELARSFVMNERIETNRTSQ